MAQEIGVTNGTATTSDRRSVANDICRRVHDCPLWSEFQRIRELVAQCEADIRQGTIRRLPGNAAFLADGRVLCRERSRGESRYPYGSDGFNLWVTASGMIHANQGLYFIFLPTLEGEQPPIAFMAGVQSSGVEDYVSHSLLPVPLLAETEARTIDRYSVIGHDAAYFVTETPELLSVVRVFLSQTRPQHAHLHFSCLIQNVTRRPLNLFTSAYMNPFCRHQFESSSEDRWFKDIRVAEHSDQICREREERLERGAILPPFLIRTNEDVSRFRSIANYALLRRSIAVRNAATSQDLSIATRAEFGMPAPSADGRDIVRLETEECTSQLAFLGSPRRSLASASFLKTGTFSREVARTVFNDNAILGNLARCELPSDAYLRTDYFLSLPENKDVLALELSRPLGPADADQTLKQQRQRTREQGNLSLSFFSGSWNGLDTCIFNHFLPFLKKQVEVCANIQGYLQRSPNSLVGFRDVFQAIDGHLFDRPIEARTKILEALGMVFVDGRCPRQYSLPMHGKPGPADLREFIDQGVWAISTVYNYCSVTGDQSILHETIGYQQLTSANGTACEPSGERGTVLEHLFRIMSYLDRNRDPESGLVLSLYGDWNDALDGLGVSEDPELPFGSGVSIMTTLQLAQNCSEIVEMLTHYFPGEQLNALEHYRRMDATLRAALLKHAVDSRDDSRRILHGWGDRRRYVVGGFQDCDGLSRDGLTSNAFWILSDMLKADPTLKPHLLAAFERLDSPFGFKTFSPGFGPEANGVGRIKRLPIGAAENGAAYLHATTFAIAALFRVGQAKQAWQQIAKIMPFAPHHRDSSHSPFVMPNSYVFNPQLNLTGQSMNDWQTGCSNVLLKLFVRQVFGFQPGLRHLRIAPANWLPFAGFEFEGTAHRRKVRIVYRFGDVLRRSFVVKGVPLEESRYDESSETWFTEIAYGDLDASQTNFIEIFDPPPLV